MAFIGSDRTMTPESEQSQKKPMLEGELEG